MCKEGDLADMIEDFNDGRIQFAYVKIKDPNSKLPKNVLIGWVWMILVGIPRRADKTTVWRGCS